jgi:large subunit ribosomal protein L10
LAISKTRKDTLLETYIELLKESRAVFFVEYGGLSVKQLESLRQEIRQVNGAYSITKNTLMRLALEETGYPVPEAFLTGQTATGFVMGEIPAMAKALVNYAKTVEAFNIKGGILEQRLLSQADIEALAELPPLDQLRSQIIGLVNGPARNLAGVVASGVRQVINVLDAYAKQDQPAEAAA